MTRFELAADLSNILGEIVDVRCADGIVSASLIHDELPVSIGVKAPASVSSHDWIAFSAPRLRHWIKDYVEA